MRWVRAGFAAIRFAGFYLVELTLSNLRVAWDAITPPLLMRPALVEVPLDCRSEFETMLYSNLVTMTPGTMAVDLSEDGRRLVVHVLYADDSEQTVRELKDFERRLLEVLRP